MYLAYSVLYPTGEARTGTISPTEDVAQDSYPRLALDPASRKPILVWSRDDGTSLQIAYARFEVAGWTDFHYLTFSRSRDSLPRIGTALNGSYLYYVEDGLRYMYAPLDLSHGRLYASPRAISKGSLVRDTGDSTMQGGQDVPIVISKHCDKSPCKEASVWDVGSRQTCRPQVLVIPNGELLEAYVVRFDDGTSTVLAAIPLPDPTQIPDDFGLTTAAAYLESLCGSMP